MEVESNVNTFEFIWKIYNYSMSYQKNGEFLRSPEFNAACIGGSRWFLTLYPKGKSTRSEGYISCYLNRCDDYAEENITVCFDLYFLTPNNKVFVHCQSNKNQVFEKSAIHGFSKFVKEEIVFHNLKKCFEDVLTIQCIITREELLSRCETVTEIGFDQYFFSLEDIEFDVWNDSKMETFPFTETSSVDAEIIISRNKMCISFKNFQDIKLQFLKCKITVDEISKTASHLFVSTTDIWKFPSIPLSVDIEDSFDYEIFDFKFEFCVPNGKESCNTIHVIDTIASLRDDMRRMFLEKIHTDVILKVDKHEIPAHKGLLSTRSPVFFAMFERNMTESNTGIVDILDIDVDTFQTFIQFLYTGKVANINYSSVSKLLIAGYKYQVKALVEKCSSFLLSIISIQNALDTLVLADMISYEPLKVSTLNYIKSHSVEFLSTPDWSQFLQNNRELGSEVLFKLSLHFRDVLEKV